MSEFGFESRAFQLIILTFRARYRKGFRTVFVPISSELNENAEDEYMVNAALVAGLYPKILIAEGGNGLKTLGNNQAISIVRDPGIEGVNWY
jgi:hypothetical protein